MGRSPIWIHCEKHLLPIVPQKWMACTIWLCSERGVEKITTACQDVNLEGGIYDLTLAEHFVGDGNLDAFAESLRTYARLYIIAASYWDQDWFQAQNFFAQVMTGYPNMSDSSCKNATRRWVEATLKIADQYIAAGDPCRAEEQFSCRFHGE